MSKEEAATFLNKMSVLFKVDHIDDMAKEYRQVEYVRHPVGNHNLDDTLTDVQQIGHYLHCPAHL